ncbi:MAG: hypothetical protein CW691_03300 [Candidatus Bathyarchaeum sp.]|nr:MAG: hypothetical protein CW691_03300 [Candidatus Bathyarchaeum sp.]
MTIEYVILIPLLFTQIIVFPFVASTMTSSWQDSQRDIQLQDAANHLASTIQQFYLTVNRDEILVGTVTQASTLPVTIGSYPYNATGSLSEPADGSAKVLTVTLTLDTVDNNVTAAAMLGPNVKWIDSTLRSNSVDASVNVQKFSNGTLVFSFGG